MRWAQEVNRTDNYRRKRSRAGEVRFGVRWCGVGEIGRLGLWYGDGSQVPDCLCWWSFPGRRIPCAKRNLPAIAIPSVERDLG